MSWTIFVSDNAQWVSAPINYVFGLDEIKEGEDLYFKNFGFKPDSYSVYGEDDEEIYELMFSVEESSLKYKEYIRGDAPVEVIIHHSSCVLGPDAWKGRAWEIWDSKGDSPWIETKVKYEDITLGFIKSGIEVFEESHDKAPDTIIISYCDSQLIFDIKKMATQSELALLTDGEILEDTILIISLPPGDGGETVDEEEIVNIVEILKYKKAA
jgi:hypothetical protein